MTKVYDDKKEAIAGRCACGRNAWKELDDPFPLRCLKCQAKNEANEQDLNEVWRMFDMSDLEAVEKGNGKAKDDGSVARHDVTYICVPVPRPMQQAGTMLDAGILSRIVKDYLVMVRDALIDSGQPELHEAEHDIKVRTIKPDGRSIEITPEVHKRNKRGKNMAGNAGRHAFSKGGYGDE